MAKQYRNSIPLIAGLIVTGGYLLVWMSVVVIGLFQPDLLPRWISWGIYAASLPLGAAWILWARRRLHRRALCACLVASISAIVWWRGAVFATGALDLMAWRATVARWGTVGLYVVGLAWVVWGLDRASQLCQRRRQSRTRSTNTPALYPLPQPPLVWNPLDAEAWFYGWRSKKLNQSIIAIMAYSLKFMLILLLLSQLRGCTETYEMPPGGGEPTPMVHTVQIQKVIRKKYVVNPYSSMVLDVPDINEVKLELNKITRHEYTQGYGKDKGAGFGGTKEGKVRFIRLSYDDGDWDLNHGKGGDDNLLRKYEEWSPGTKVAKRSESRRIAQLRNFPAQKAPPLVFMTGQKHISVSNTDVKTLREYLLDKHGMVFATAGSSDFHNHFLALMRRVLPEIQPVRVPVDEPIIHAGVPDQLYVSPHGGKEPLGWKRDGRWVCYYHPGDLSDAWRDNHSGVSMRVWQPCYQLGYNVIFYAHLEHAKWREAQQKDGE